MTGRRDLSALPDALRRLAAALDDVLALAALLPLAAAGPEGRTGAASTADLASALAALRTGAHPYGTAPVPGRTRTGHDASPGTVRRLCAWCHRPLPAGMRVDAIFCSTRCRKARHRAGGPNGPLPPPDGPVPDGETLVALLWPTRQGAGVTVRQDVERRPRRNRRPVFRGRVRWIDPATGQYRGHTRTFDTPAEAWAWVRTYTAPAPGDEMHPPLAEGCISDAQLRANGTRP
jgi:hypothetical protein